MTLHQNLPASERPHPAGAAVTAVLHLIALWPYAISGLAAPAWAILCMLAIWALLGVAAWRIHQRWGIVAAIAPLVAVVVWFGLMSIGEAALGWAG